VLPFKKDPMKDKYETLFKSELGKEVLAHICKNGHVTTTTFVKGDPNETTLNEGMRRLALSILRYACKNEEDTINRIKQEYYYDEV
jgi:hypothetical protein